MTTREKRIESAVEVHLFDRTDADRTSNIEFHHASKLAKDTEYVRPDRLRLEPFGKWGYVDTPEGLYVFVDEGVGSSNPLVEKDDYVQIDLYVHIDADPDAVADENGVTSQGSFGVFPEVGLRLTADEIRERATGETVPLHDFIRKFGQRLEDNYHLWKRTLEAALEEVS